MTSLKAQVKLLREQLEISEAADDYHHRIVEYSSIAETLTASTLDLEEQLGHFETVSKIPGHNLAADRVTLLAVVTNAQNAMDSFRTRWISEGHRARQGDDLAHAENTSALLIRNLGSAIERAWTEWISALIRDADLDDVLLNEQRTIHGEKGIYSEFKEARTTFLTLATVVTNNTDIIAKILKAKEEMIEIKSKMIFNHPQNVLAFFKAMEEDRQNRASLKYVTPEVWEWLSERNMLSSYTVGRR